MIHELYGGKRALVTGGAGFVGSRLTRALVRLWSGGHGLRQDLFTGQRDLLPDGVANFVEASVTDRDALAVVEGMDYVFHLAARNITVSMARPTEDLETNIGGTLNVLLACQELKRRPVVVHIQLVGLREPSVAAHHGGRPP